jgi:hypothetical protein
VEATLVAPNTTATTWSYTFNPPVADAYSATATARDSTGSDTTPAGPANFTVTGSTVDTVAPDATVTSPTNNQLLPRSTVTFTGNATDNVGVADVRVAIRSGTTGAFRWWNGTAWVTSTTWLTGATLSSPGSPTTGWSFSAWTPTVAGPYSVTVRAQDAAGGLDATRPWVNFSVS